MNRVFIFATALAALVLPATVRAQSSYSVFRVCEDQHVIRTSDGAEAGHVEYIVVDPGQQRVVTSLVSGGAVGERLVAVPFSSMRFSNEREVVLTEINRERLVSAPVIERTQISTTARFEPALVERSFTHFGVRADAVGVSSSTTRTEVARPGDRPEDRPPRPDARPGELDNRPPGPGQRGDAAAAPSRDPRNPGDRPDRPDRPGDRPNAEAARPDARGNPEAERERNARPGQPPAAREGERNRPDATPGSGTASPESRRSPATPPPDAKGTNAEEKSNAERKRREAAPDRPGAAESARPGEPEAAQPSREGRTQQQQPRKSESAKEQGANAADKAESSAKSKRSSGEPEGVKKDEKREQ